MSEEKLFGCIVVPVYSYKEMMEVCQRVEDKTFQFQKCEKLKPLPIDQELYDELGEKE